MFSEPGPSVGTCEGSGREIRKQATLGSELISPCETWEWAPDIHLGTLIGTYEGSALRHGPQLPAVCLQSSWGPGLMPQQAKSDGSSRTLCSPGIDYLPTVFCGGSGAGSNHQEVHSESDPLTGRGKSFKNTVFWSR